MSSSGVCNVSYQILKGLIPAKTLIPASSRCSSRNMARYLGSIILSPEVPGVYIQLLQKVRYFP